MDFRINGTKVRKIIVKKNGQVLTNSLNKLVCNGVTVYTSVVEPGAYDAKGNLIKALTKQQIESGDLNLGSSVVSIVFPQGVTSIGHNAFYNCTSLTSIEIPSSVTSIGYSAFLNCSSLTSITIPDSVTSIGYEAFYGCTSLTSITIPEGVNKIGYEAFSSCSKLTSVTIPSSVTSIGEYAFYNCTKLTSIKFDGGLRWFRSDTDNKPTMLNVSTSATTNAQKLVNSSAGWSLETSKNTVWVAAQSATTPYTFNTTSSYGNEWKSNNQGVDNSTAIRKWNILSLANKNYSIQYKVGSEEDFDYLDLYLDGNQILTEASGSISNSLVIQLTANKVHVLEARYSKDGSSEDYDDTAWVTFPNSVYTQEIVV